ncbi:hypothetical protein D9757_005004 [Collybiopsis confluens]|uniref:Epoxide hydrolase N-terminal domain-containing protein n=1 Tax=Collybiopsis confluens TaxID=2823264 RepID=A0A8H5HTC7_9AGAR|nr:hypothetical protein D9757_005004 [Collybiopsis confluens]
MPVTWSKPTPFSIHIPDARIQSLQAAVEAFDFDHFDSNILSTPISEGDFSLGLPPIIAKRLVERLKSGYDWRKYERVMNEIGNHYIVQVDGIPGESEPLKVHIIERRSKREDATPIVLNHGWPGSFFEFHKLAPLLADPPNPDDQAFHCIIPSMPGYTFSSPPKSHGWDGYKVATAVDAAVQALGYKIYLAQAWRRFGLGNIQPSGFRISRTMQRNPRVSCLIFIKQNKQSTPRSSTDLNAIPFSYLPTEEQKANMSPDEIRGLEAGAEFEKSGSAYLKMNQTVPYTVGLMLASSALAALFYIGEKLYRWAAPESVLSIDDVLTSALLYIYSGSLTSTLWLYVAPTFVDHSHKKIDVPSAFSSGRADLLWAPKAQAEEQYRKLLWWRILKEGGHFLALEKPELLAGELREFASKNEVKKSLSAD